MAKAKMGRPKERVYDKKIAKVVEELAKLGCPIREIAGIMTLNYKHLWIDYRTEWERGNGDLTQRLRGAQIDKALVEKNAQMLIHLGKHYLAQSDAMLISNSVDEEAVEEMDTGDLIALVKQNSD